MRTGTVSYKLEDLKKGVIIPIGFVGENDFTRVIFDAEEIYKKYPSASVSMKVQPPKGVIYPAAVTRDGNTVIWQVKEADVANRGGGELQLTFIDGETKIKTYIAKTDVKRSLAGNGPAPDPVQDWVDNAEEVLDDLAAMDNIAKTAETVDIGKALSPKTVENGVVTEWQYVEPGGGTEDYDDLDNKPAIGGVTLSGDKSLTDLGIASADSVSELSGDVADIKNDIAGQNTKINGIDNEVLSIAGVNITWEVGTIGGADGQDASSPNRLRVKGYIPISIFIKATQHGNGSFKYFAYDSNKAYLGTADWTQTYLASVTKSEVTTAYPTAKYVRILWRWTNEASTSLSDVQRADLRIKQDTYKASVDASISDIDDKVKKKCGLITNSGRVFTADMLTITGTNTTVKDDNSKVFAKTAKRITASADSATVKLSLGGDYAFDTVTVVFYLPYDSYKGDSPTALDLRIYANATTNTPIVSASNCCWGWNFLKIPRNKMGLGQSLVISSIDMVFKKTSDTTETNFGEIVVDSIIIDMEMKPTFILDFDQIWEESIENGAYEYCRTNNIPYTIHTYQYANLNAAKQAEMKKAMLNGCEFSYYGAFTSANELKNATSYSDALAECVLMENDIIPATSKRFITYGCGAHIMNRPLRESLEASGVKAIRGRWTQNPIGYFCDRSTWLPYSIEISYGNSTHEDMTNHIYEALTHGSCVVAFTHGVCDDDEDHLGASSSAIRISDFKYLIDYLVSLRNQGKIQICTMEQFVNQCIN